MASMLTRARLKTLLMKTPSKTLASRQTDAVPAAASET